MNTIAEDKVKAIREELTMKKNTPIIKNKNYDIIEMQPTFAQAYYDSKLLSSFNFLYQTIFYFSFELI